MPTINPSLVPTVAAGNLFSTLTQDETLSVRWLMPVDPVYSDVINRPIVDTILRQLILAKSLDQISLSVGQQSLFPFLVQCRLTDGTTEVDSPAAWIYSLNISAPHRWQNFRLAKVMRLSGENGTEEGTGVLRLVITANASSSLEVAMFYADYTIDSELTFQRHALLPADNLDDEPVTVSTSESSSLKGFITFRTLDTQDTIVEAFLEALAPSDLTDDNLDGLYDNPTTLEAANTAAGGTGVTDDFSTSSLTHGSGLFVDSVYSPIPPLDTNIDAWLAAFNFPFDAAATMTSSGSTGVVVPIGLFDEFNITAPAGDLPSGSSASGYFPVWLSKIEQADNTVGSLRFIFSTYSTRLSSPGVDPIEFASMVLDPPGTSTPGLVVPITPKDNLLLEETNPELFDQHFGRGNVVLSSLWGGTTTEVADFFSDFDTLESAEFGIGATRISAHATSRVPKFSPTFGQAQALVGTMSDRDTPVPPSSTNRFVTEQDTGTGDQVDLDGSFGAVEGIDRYGYRGGLVHRIVSLCIDNTQIDNTDATFYQDNILPRLVDLLGRSPVAFDMWWDGTRLKFYDTTSQAWIG
jgi:hypothetical protein